MKHTLLTYFLFCASLAFGQINITSNDMPQPGDTLRYSIASPSANFLSSYKNTGANYTWNFMNLQPIAQDVDKYIPSSQTAYNFSNTTAHLFADTMGMGGMELTDVYEFWKLDTSQLQIVGRGFTYNGLGFPMPISVPYIDTGVVYQFPLTYNDRDSNYFVAEYSQPFLGVFYQAKGYRINEVDGYGQISTPYGTFNCIRVVTDIVESDTIHYDTIDFKINTHLKEYKWLANGIKYPILKVSGVVVSGVFTPTMVSYRDSIRNLTVGLKEQNLASRATVYPNPNNGDYFAIDIGQGTENGLKVELLDVSGKLIHSYGSHLRNYSKGSFVFRLPENILNGIYFLRINTNGNGFMEKLVVNK